MFNFTFSARQFVIISIVSLFAVLIASQTVQANEFSIQPTSSDDIAYTLKMTNTPGYGDLGNHWDEYVASLHWTDYAQPETVAVVFVNASEIAYDLKITNTPGYGDLGNHWDEYVASLHWTDYTSPLAINDAPLAVTRECGLAC